MTNDNKVGRPADPVNPADLEEMCDLHVSKGWGAVRIAKAVPGYGKSKISRLIEKYCKIRGSGSREKTAVAKANPSKSSAPTPGLSSQDNITPPAREGSLSAARPAYVPQKSIVVREEPFEFADDVDSDNLDNEADDDDYDNSYETPAINNYAAASMYTPSSYEPSLGSKIAALPGKLLNMAEDAFVLKQIRKFQEKLYGNGSSSTESNPPTPTTPAIANDKSGWRETYERLAQMLNDTIKETGPDSSVGRLSCMGTCPIETKKPTDGTVADENTGAGIICSGDHDRKDSPIPSTSFDEATSPLDNTLSAKPNPNKPVETATPPPNLELSPTLVVPGPSNDSDNRRALTQPPAKVALQPSELALPAETSSNEAPTGNAKLEQTSVATQPSEVSMNSKGIVVQTSISLSADRQMQGESSENLSADAEISDVEVDSKQLISNQPGDVSQLVTSSEDIWDIVAICAIDIAGILALLYLDQQTTQAKQSSTSNDIPSNLPTLLNPTPVNASQTESSSKSPSLYSVPVENENTIVF
jgi:hypothetical protein